MIYIGYTHSSVMKGALDMDRFENFENFIHNSIDSKLSTKVYHTILKLNPDNQTDISIEMCLNDILNHLSQSTLSTDFLKCQ